MKMKTRVRIALLSRYQRSIGARFARDALDDIVADRNLERIDFIKMDIEGAERRALRGLNGH